jgi:hypothetical protein
MKIHRGYFFICIIGFLLVIGFSSCSKKEVQIPKDILSRQELVPVLVDMHLAQAALGINQLTDSTRYSMKDYSSYIFKSHHTTKEKYEQTLAFYTAHPELLDEIYSEVINELSKKQSETQRK